MKFFEDHAFLTVLISIIGFLVFAGLIFWNWGDPESAVTGIVIDQSQVDEVHHRVKVLEEEEDDLAIDEESEDFVDLMDKLQQKEEMELEIPESEVGRSNPMRPSGGWISEYGTEEE